MDRKSRPKVIGRRIVFESQKFRVVEKDMEFAGGEKATWEVVESTALGGARTIALTALEDLIFIREYRAASDKYVVRFPTGGIEHGESPAQAALRELEEETGFRSEKLEFLGTLESVSGYYKGAPIHIFFAWNAEFTGDVNREIGEQDIEVLHIPLQEAWRMAEEVEFEDPQTVYALLLAKKHLQDLRKSED